MYRSERSAIGHNAPAVFVILILNLILVSYACAASAQELSQEAAVDMVRKHRMFDIFWTIRIHTREIHMSIEEVEKYQPYYSALKSLDLISLSNPTVETPEGKKTRTDRTVVSLTEKGREQSKEWQEPNKDEWIITAAVREFVELVRFYNDDKGAAYVEFFWTYVPNSIGEATGQQFRKEKAVAYLHFKEGEWQIRTIRASS